MFSEAKARRVTRFIEGLKHTKGEFHGKPFKLLPWQETIIRDVFGMVRDDEGLIRIYYSAGDAVVRLATAKEEDLIALCCEKRK